MAVHAPLLFTFLCYIIGLWLILYPSNQEREVRSVCISFECILFSSWVADLISSILIFIIIYSNSFMCLSYLNSLSLWFIPERKAECMLELYCQAYLLCMFGTWVVCFVHTIKFLLKLVWICVVLYFLGKL